MRSRILVAAAGIVVLAASAALAILGRAVLDAPAAVRRAAPVWPDRAHAPARERSLADRAAAALLATNRADPFNEIVATYRNAVELQASAGDPRGPVKISRLIPELRSDSERSQALVMAGTLLAYSAGSGFGVVLPKAAGAPEAVLVAQALENFRAAIRTDPSNEEAKYDLELLLRQQRAQAPKSPAKQKEKRPTTQDTRKKKSATTNGQEHHAGIYATGSGY